MKCLEFLYFYLLPEDGNAPSSARCTSSPMRRPPLDSTASKESPSKSVPASPVHGQFRDLGLLSPGVGRAAQLSPREHNEEGSTDVAEPPSTPPLQRPKSPKKAAPSTPGRKPTGLQLLQGDIDYMPVSPKKAQVAGLGVGTPGRPRHPTGKGSGSALGRTVGPDTASGPKLVFPSFAPSTPARKKMQLMKPAEIKQKEDTPVRREVQAGSPAKRALRLQREGFPRSQSNTSILSETTNTSPSRSSPPASPIILSRYIVGEAHWPSELSQTQLQKGRTRSTEEKKALLGTWLGNVDALVDGVQRAGIWGLA